MKDFLKMLFRRIVPKEFRRIQGLRTEKEEDRILRMRIIEYLEKNDIPETVEIIQYLKSNGLGVFNYFWADKHIYSVNRIKFDKSNGLFYTMLYRKRMYFKRGMGIESCNAYLNSLLLEQDDNSPHNYLTKKELECFNARTVVDCGAAEGIFALSVCDKAK